MIVDMFSNLSFYCPMIKNLDKGIEAAKKHWDSPIEGRYEFEGGFFTIMKGVTKPMAEGTFEAHRKYVDIQIVVEGSEDMAWAPLNQLTEVIPYSEEKDAARYDGAADHIMHISAGMCYVAFPDDGHRPIRHVGAEQSYTKIVMKLPV